MKAKKSPREQLEMIAKAGLDFAEYCVLGTARLGVPRDELPRHTVGLTEGDPRGNVTEDQCRTGIARLVRIGYLDESGRLTDVGEEDFRTLVESLGYHWAMPFEFPED